MLPPMRLLLLSLGLLVATPCASSGPPATDLRALEAEVGVRINAHRKAAGKPELASNDELARIARRHSERMASGRIRLGHDGMQDRVDELVAGLGISRYAENVSRHDRDAGFVDAAVTRWLASPSHRKNIDGPYTASGVGAARSADGAVYFTQVFVALR